MEEEEAFNINTMLENLFQSLDQDSQNGRANLVFMFSKTVPRQLKGDVSTLHMVLYKILKHILKNEYNDEVFVTVDAPEEFLYKELVSFKITNIPIKKEEIMSDLQKLLSDDLEKLDASLEFTEDHGGSLEVTLLLTNAELGCRRYYRLPSESMLNKNILLIIESNNVALSLLKMFKYFPMNVDLCIKKCRDDRHDFSSYDLVLIDDMLFGSRFEELISMEKNRDDVKFVLFGNKDIYSEDDESKLHSAFLEKPATQESVFKLLVLLFDES